MKKKALIILILLSAFCLAACHGQQGEDTETVAESVTPDIAVTTVSPDSSESPDTEAVPDVSTETPETSADPVTVTSAPETKAPDVTTAPVQTEALVTSDKTVTTATPETEKPTPDTSEEVTTASDTEIRTPETKTPDTEDSPITTGAPETQKEPIETTQAVSEDTTTPADDTEETKIPDEPDPEPEIKGWPSAFIREKFGEDAVPEPECKNAETVFDANNETIRITGITLDEYYAYIEKLGSVGFIYDGEGSAYRRLIGDTILIADIRFGETFPKAFSLISFDVRDAKVWPASDINDLFGFAIIPDFPEGDCTFFVQSAYEGNSTIRIGNINSSAITEYIAILGNNGFTYDEIYDSYTKTVGTTVFSVTLDSESEDGTVYMILASYSAPVWPADLLENTFGTADFLPEFVSSDGIFYSDTAGSRLNIIISDTTEAEKKKFTEDLLAMGYVYSDELDGYVKRENGYRSHVCITDGEVILISVSHIPYEAFPVSVLADTVWYYTVPVFESKYADFAVDWSGSDDDTMKVYGFGVTDSEVAKYIVKLLDFGYVNTVFDEVYSFSYSFLGKKVSVTLKYDMDSRLLTFVSEYQGDTESN